MKTRNGFVSNSSSSSFVILSTKENIKQALSLLPKKAAKFIKSEFVSGSPSKLLVDGKPYVLYQGTYYTDNWPVEYCECEDSCKCQAMDEGDFWEHIKTFERNVKPFAKIDEY